MVRIHACAGYRIASGNRFLDWTTLLWNPQGWNPISSTEGNTAVDLMYARVQPASFE